MAAEGDVLTAEATISTQTDTALIDISAIIGATYSASVLEFHVGVFVAASGAKLRCEVSAGGAVIAALGMADGATIGNKIEKVFHRPGYNLGIGNDLSIETSGGNATYYVYVKYMVASKAQVTS
jgi:hypothetical protein